MSAKLSRILAVLLLALLVAAPAYAAPGKPNFGEALYADGATWGTKGTTPLPAPNDHNSQSFDALYVITNSSDPAGQLPVGEAAPGNPDFNGGRWATQTVMWTAAGFAAHGGTVPVLTSQADVLYHQGMGHLTITPGSPPGGPPPYFQCPLLPVK